jgi:hypothetical protein
MHLACFAAATRELWSASNEQFQSSSADACARNHTRNISDTFDVRVCQTRQGTICHTRCCCGPAFGGAVPVEVALPASQHEADRQVVFTRLVSNVCLHASETSVVGLWCEALLLAQLLLLLYCSAVCASLLGAPSPAASWGCLQQLLMRSLLL